jgi:predicted nucleic acid-binding protein
MKLKKNKIILSLITLLTIFCFTISAFSAETASIDEQIEQLKNILNSSSSYSAFWTRRLLNTAQNLIESGIPFEDTKKIVENSVEKSFSAYSIKEVFDVLLEALQEGLPAEPLINKVNEGFAKNVNKTIIISVISAKAENLKQANEILTEARQEGLEINGSEEIIEILADSLENDVPQEALSWLVKTGTKEGRSIEEITEISEELSYLSLMASDSGLSTEKISLLFKKAMDNSSNIADICENIQKNLESEISTAKIESGGVKPSTTLGSGTSPTSLTGSETTIGGTPTEEAGEAPTETGETPEPSTPPADETPSPPEN